MDAVVSGIVGAALIIAEPGCLYSIHAHSPNERIERRPMDFARLFGDATDLIFLEDTDEWKVRQELYLAATCEDALQLALILLDGKAIRSVRKEAAVELEELLADDRTEARLSYILYAVPLPKDASIPAELEVKASPKTSKQFDDLRNDQEYIERVCGVISNLHSIHLAWGLNEEWLRFRALAVRFGLIKDFVKFARRERLATQIVKKFQSVGMSNRAQLEPIDPNKVIIRALGEISGGERATELCECLTSPELLGPCFAGFVAHQRRESVNAEDLRKLYSQLLRSVKANAAQGVIEILMRLVFENVPNVPFLQVLVEAAKTVHVKVHLEFLIDPRGLSEEIVDFVAEDLGDPSASVYFFRIPTEQVESITGIMPPAAPSADSLEHIYQQAKSSHLKVVEWTA